VLAAVVIVVVVVVHGIPLQPFAFFNTGLLLPPPTPPAPASSIPTFDEECIVIGHGRNGRDPISVIAPGQLLAVLVPQTIFDEAGGTYCCIQVLITMIEQEGRVRRDLWFSTKDLRC